ncbi:tetratricopeptide repeat protein [Desulfonema magnum]|uniref:Tetratricopeptide repeat-containing protein n=1 Tax=Desulfonema magnum TaxID=45655 RepID=A0A975GPA7_9BACT|nr:tetratricopeptide repeat protein [Desulfonema magnum]QTA88605.1 Tetratricopeptide repeat-containing protein [Desulfonema magnum]
MAKKKVSRKALLKEPDEFLSFSRRLFLFVMEHQVQISIGLGIFFAVILAISGIRYFSDRAETNASALVAKAVEKYETAMKDKTAAEAYAEVQTDFQKILKAYSGKESGKLARVIYAGVCYNGGAFDKAIQLYNEAIQDFDANPSFKNLILSSLGYAYEGKKDFKNAVKYFEQITKAPELIMKDEAFFNLGRLYAEMGNTDKSMDAFKKIIADYGDSIYIELVKETLRSEELVNDPAESAKNG